MTATFSEREMESTTRTEIRLGQTTLGLRLAGDRLLSLGEVRVGDARLRNDQTRFLPWFDTYDGDVFRAFRLRDIVRAGERVTLLTTVTSDPDVLFRERRDSSGDLAFRNTSWDAPALEAEFRVVLEPAQAAVAGRHFRGFKYHYEYEGATPIHRIVDRQTWELGGDLEDVNIVCRNWLTPPRMRIARDTTYSTVGLDAWAGLLPGNMWGRWSLLPAFDMQYGKAGVFLAWFDRMSLIRTVIESNAGEDSIRHLDMHLFEQGTHVATNPKTVLWCADPLDHIDAMNLWTAVHDQEQAKSLKQIGVVKLQDPQLWLSENRWINMRFDTTYENVVDVAAEFGFDYAFIDPVWQHHQSFFEYLQQWVPQEKWKGTILEKFCWQNMCVTLDFEVGEIQGGEERLKALCDRAAAKGVKVVSWMATHYSPESTLNQDKSLAYGKTGFNIWAARESGRHPDTGYPASCWTINLNNPVLYEKLRNQILGVCRRTGLAGFLWDSFCNLGWWQIDYANGTMRPQFDRMAQLFADLTNAGLYLMPEAIVTFSNGSMCGLHGGNVYAGDLLGYSYNTGIALHYGTKVELGGFDDTPRENLIIQGKLPFDELFCCFAHKRVPSMQFQNVPRDTWSPEAVGKMKWLFKLYRQLRDAMRQRTVLKDDLGVMWDDGHGVKTLFAFRDHTQQGVWLDATTGQAASALTAGNVYRRLP